MTMKTTILILLTLLMISPVSAIEPLDPEYTDWEDHGEKTLYWGESVDIGNYTIEVIDFYRSGHFDIDGDWVGLEVHGGGSVYAAILSMNNATTSTINDSAIVCHDMVKLVAKNIVTGYDVSSPYAKIRIYTRELTEPEYEDIDSWINRTLMITKYVPDVGYADEWIHVQITVKKLRDIDQEEIMVSDSLPFGFELKDPNEDLNWTFDLIDDNRCIVSYMMKTTNITEHEVPAAELVVSYNGKERNTTSNTPVIVIHSPDINITKTSGRDGSMMNVTVSVRNDGDRAARVKVTDHIPVGASLVNGTLNFSTVLQPDEECINEYTLRIASDDISLPQACADFKDFRMEEWKRICTICPEDPEEPEDKPEIKDSEIKELETPKSTPTRQFQTDPAEYSNQPETESDGFFSSILSKLKSKKKSDATSISPISSNSKPKKNKSDIPVTPGFEVPSTIAGIVVLCLMSRRRNQVE
jgi:hypothetical protein